MIMSEILKFILQLFMSIIELILSPINNLISEFLPDFDNGLVYINNFINWLSNFADFIMSWLHIPQFSINLLSGLLVFLITIRPVVFGIKIVLKWFKTLKP